MISTFARSLIRPPAFVSSASEIGIQQKKIETKMGVSTKCIHCSNSMFCEIKFPFVFQPVHMTEKRRQNSTTWRTCAKFHIFIHLSRSGKRCQSHLYVRNLMYFQEFLLNSIVEVQVCHITTSSHNFAEEEHNTYYLLALTSLTLAQWAPFHKQVEKRNEERQ